MPEILVSFSVPGPPRGKGRPRTAVIGGFARFYTPAETVSEEGAVRLFAKAAMAGREPFQAPMDVRLFAYLPIPQSWSKVKQARAVSGELLPAKKPDHDNITKLVCDAMNGIVYGDDCQVTMFVIRKRYSAEPRVVVQVRLDEGA